MTQAERNEMRTLAKTLDTVICGSPEWDKAYNRYLELCCKEQDEYRDEHYGKLRQFYEEHIADREWNEIDQGAWDFYSDYHKDVFGYRPRGISFGE